MFCLIIRLRDDCGRGVCMNSETYDGTSLHVLRVIIKMCQFYFFIDAFTRVIALVPVHSDRSAELNINVTCHGLSRCSRRVLLFSLTPTRSVTVSSRTYTLLTCSYNFLYSPAPSPSRSKRVHIGYKITNWISYLY